MTSAVLPLPVFMKNVFSVPSLNLETIFDVEAELQPPPPAEDTEVVSASSCRSFKTAGSTLIVNLVVWRRQMLSISWLICERCVVVTSLLYRSRRNVFTRRSLRSTRRCAPSSWIFDDPSILGSSAPIHISIAEQANKGYAGILDRRSYNFILPQTNGNTDAHDRLWSHSFLCFS